MENINITDTKLDEVLRDVVGKDKAEEALNGVKSLVKEEVNNGVKMLATKEQWLASKEELSQKIFETREELSQQIFITREQIAQTKEELNQKISETKSELIRTIYIVGLIQFLAIVGSVLGIMTFIIRYVKD